MIETFMFFVLGFLAAALLALAVAPFVHNRAERLAVRRMQASIPLSIAEVHAGRDHLRAEFAMSTRRLEISIEQLRAKTAGALAELGKKDAVINRLRAELGAKAAGAPSNKGDAIAVRTEWLPKVGPALANTEVVRLKAELDGRSRVADSQRIEIVALKIQIDALKDQIADLEKPRAQPRIDPEKRRASLRLVN